MNKRLNMLIVAIVCLLMFPAVTFAQLPAPTYGWNLGNTLEPPCGEGCWAPAATQQLINAVADAGFNTVRIPVAWDSHANQTTYEIDPAWLARVKEVVDWCYARNLHVLVNSHWDTGWLDNALNGTVDPTVDAKMDAYWTQIANTFIAYDDRLLFAGANEPPADTAAKMAELLTYYQTFVDAVRATGGQNTNRWLVLSGPKTDIDKTDSLMNTLPYDPTPGRLMVEVHDYSPYNFTMMTQDQSWGNMFYFWGQGYHHPTRLDRNPTWGEEDYIISQYEKMRIKFTSQGIPVIVGEFGTCLRSGYSDLTGADYDLHVASRTYWNKTLVDAANARGLRPVYWDNGYAGSGGYALFDRNTAAVIDQDSVTALTGGPALPPPGSDTTPPSAPTGLTAAVLDGVFASLDWNDNTEGDLQGYNIYRSTTPGSGYTKLNSSVVSGSDYIDTATPGGETYYVVTAVDTSLNESDDSNEVSATTLFTAMGSILYERWTGISGPVVSDLTSNVNYPDNPSFTSYITLLEGPTNILDDYGTRIRGYLYPPTTGSYTFWIAGDDYCELWLSTDGTPAHAAMIASVSGWTDSREWNKFSSQQSAAKSLVAGQKYYIEVLHKEAAGGDNIAVAWSGPGMSQAVIEGQYLSPWLTGLYGDFNGSGSVSIEDLSMFAGNWVSADCILTSAMDLDGDCDVDFYEFSKFAANWMN